MNIHMAEARIDLERLRRNISIVRERVGSTRILFPIKADGYGHGAVGIARVAESMGIDYFGVANLLEAAELRAAGITRPILILSASHPQLAGALAETDVTPTVSTWPLAEALEREAAKRGRTIQAHVKVDTGMGRNGLLESEAPDFVAHLHDNCPHIEVEGIFSHFSVSYSESDADRAFSEAQIEAFEAVLDELERRDLLPPLRHIANSSGLIQFEGAVSGGRYNMIRPGVLLYGYPEVHRDWTAGIRPLLQVVTRIVSLKRMPAGRTIGYGRHYRTPSERLIATLPVGYADGISPLLANNGEVILHGRRARMVGGISMDQITVDMTEIPEARIGDEVELIGESMTAEEIAAKIDARFTEVVLTALSKRVARVYI